MLGFGNAVRLGMVAPMCTVLSAALACQEVPGEKKADKTLLAPARPKNVRWLAVGGGPTPDSNQVSIEQDIGLVPAVIGDQGLVLFAGGPGASGVQVIDRRPRGDRLLHRLGELFAPRPGRDAHYRRISIPVHGAATKAAFNSELEGALANGTSPFLLYVAGHGEIGPTPRDNGFFLWEHGFVSVAELAALVDRIPTRRQLRLIITTCYSGGFAELAFAAADPESGPAPSDRCGVFSTVWDLQSSGCDPEPNRRAQEGYGWFLLQALAGRDHRGQPAWDKADLDSDGAISLLEAHTLVRISTPAADVPTTTSERWLEVAVPKPRPGLAPLTLAEEAAVVEGLARRLGIAGREQIARTRLEDLERRAEQVQNRLDEARAAEERAFGVAAGALLSRWPTLDDPWHPDHKTTLDRERRAIEAFVAGSKELQALAENQQLLNRLDAKLWDLRRLAAPYERLVRAMNNQLRAAHLKEEKGEAWAVYQRLLACERSAP